MLQGLIAVPAFFAALLVRTDRRLIAALRDATALSANGHHSRPPEPAGTLALGPAGPGRRHRLDRCGAGLPQCNGLDSVPPSPPPSHRRHARHDRPTRSRHRLGAQPGIVASVEPAVVADGATKQFGSVGKVVAAAPIAFGNEHRKSQGGGGEGHSLLQRHIGWPRPGRCPPLRRVEYPGPGRLEAGEPGSSARGGGDAV